jgi:hypothetical protein
MINVKNPLKMTFQIGGFLIHDNGFTIQVKVNDKILNFSKKNYITFMKLTSKDLFINKLKKAI